MKLTINDLIQYAKENNLAMGTEIKIKGGNQFHIRRDTGSLIGYMNAEQCWYALKGIMTSLLYMERQVD